MDFSGNLSLSDILTVINNVSIFSGIGIPEQHLLANKCHLLQSDKEEMIIDQGAVGDTLYVIIKGRVNVLIKSASKGWVRVNTLGPGDVFGEIAILRGIPRTARITTQTPCLFLTVSAKEFLDIYQYFPPKSRDNIQLVVAKRLAHIAQSHSSE